MDLKVFSIYDQKAAMFMQPMFYVNEATALRSFSQIVNAGDNDVSKHPEDFTLYHIGEYSDGTGELRDVEATVLVNALQVKEQLGPELDATEEMKAVVKEFTKLRELFATRIGAVEQALIGMKATPKKKGWFSK